MGITILGEYCKSMRDLSSPVAEDMYVVSVDALMGGEVEGNKTRRSRADFGFLDILGL